MPVYRYLYPIFLFGNNVGIGTATPNNQLEITKSFRMPETTGVTPYGIIYKGSFRFIHNFNYGNNGTVTTSGGNTFIGIEAGNLTMGSTATLTTHSSFNTGVGYQSLYSNTSGGSNTANGYQSLYSNTIGSSNTANGMYSLYLNTTGYYNTANGMYSLYSNTSGYYNTANGMYSLYSNTNGYFNTANGYKSLYSNTTGYYNTANGLSSLYSNTTGSYNTANGYQAGRFIADGITANTTSDFSLYLGGDTKAGADDNQNEIVIGYGTIGNGSNSVTLGNTSITKTILQGSVGIGTTSPSAVSSLDLTSVTKGFLPPRMTTVQRTAITAVEGLIVYDLTLHKLYCYDGSIWQACF
jgi:hypothetical protein